jgi:hypothetical protein
MRNVLIKSCRENQNALFMFNDFFSENHAIFYIMLKRDRAREAADGNMATRCVLN